MTDNTQPKAREFTMSQYASKDDMVGAMRKRTAELEAQLEPIRAGGVQALSAAPGVTSEQRRLIGVIADKIEDGTLFQSGIYPKKDLARFVRNMLDTTPTAPAASTTPPAEHPIGEVVVTKTRDGQIVAVTRQDDEGRILSVIATSDPAEQAAPKAAPGEQDDHQILAITTAYEQGVGKGHQAYNSGKEIANPYSPAYRCDLAWQYGYKEGKEQAQREAKAAPQQEAQEPVAYVHVPHSTAEGKVRPVVSFEKYQQDYAGGIYSTRIPLYTAPQPALAPLSECLRLLNSFEYEGDEDSQAKAFFKAHINEDWFFHVKNSLELALAAQ